jgi:hypothetical protein
MTGLLVSLFTLGPSSQSAFDTVRTPRTLPNTDLNPYGVNIFLDREVEELKMRHTLEMIAEAGVGWVKQQFSWAEIEPRPGYFWDDRYDKSSWEKFDRIVDLAEEYGLQVIARVDRPPAWARPEGSNPQAPPNDPGDYADFIYEFVDHYRGRIHYVQIWNEPNLHNEWREDAPVDARSYVTLLRLAYRRAKEADPDVQILCAPLAMRDSDDPNRLYVSELTFLEEMYRADAAPYFDIMSANAYGFQYPPQASPEPGRLNFRRVELLREIMEDFGDQDKAIWFNEYGWNAAPGDWPVERLRWGRVSEQEQARWTVEGIEYAQEHWSWAGVISIWYFREVEDKPELAESYFRMVNVDFTPMPVYWAVQKATSEMSIASPGEYGEQSTPVERRGAWQPVYDAGVRGSTYIASSAPGSSLAMTFLGSDLHLRVRRGPDGGRLLVTVDGVPGRGTSLPTDSSGQAYLELYGPEEEWVDVHLVQALGREFPEHRHRLELVVAQEGDPVSTGRLCAVDGFEVVYRRSYVFLGVIAALLLAGTGVALAGVVGEWRRPLATQPQVAPLNPWTLRIDPDPESGEGPGSSAPPEEP